MFIRWKESRTGQVSCQLVESYRDDGRPRQRVVRHLSSIGKYEIDREPIASGWRVSPRELFWRKVDESIAQLVDEKTITKKDAAAYRKTIAQRVKRPRKRRAPA